MVFLTLFSPDGQISQIGAHVPLRECRKVVPSHTSGEPTHRFHPPRSCKYPHKSKRSEVDIARCYKLSIMKGQHKTQVILVQCFLSQALPSVHEQPSILKL